MNKHPSLEKADEKAEDQTNPRSLFVSSPSRSEATKTIETLPADSFSHELDPFASLLNHNGKSERNAAPLTPAPAPVLLLQKNSMFKEEILCQEKLYDRAQKKQEKDDELKTHVEAEDEQHEVPSPSAPVSKKLKLPFLEDWNNANDDYNERRNGFFLQPKFKRGRY